MEWSGTRRRGADHNRHGQARTAQAAVGSRGSLPPPGFTRWVSEALGDTLKPGSGLGQALRLQDRPPAWHGPPAGRRGERRRRRLRLEGEAGEGHLSAPVRGRRRSRAATTPTQADSAAGAPLREQVGSSRGQSPAGSRQRSGGCGAALCSLAPDRPRHRFQARASAL